MTDSLTSQRCSYQFSVRMLLLLTTLVGVGLAWYVAPQQRQNRTIAAIEKLGGSLVYRDGSDPQGVHLRDFAPTDSVLAQVRKLRGVKSLSIVFWRRMPGEKPIALTRAGLRHIASAKSLKSVTFIGTDITDAAIMELAESMPHLNSLSVYECPNITDAGIDRFKERFQNVEIEHRLP